MSKIYQPAYMIASSPGTQIRTQECLSNYSLERLNCTQFNALRYCFGGVITSTAVIDEYKYTLNMGLTHQYDEDGNGIGVKVRAFSVTYEHMEPYKPMPDGFGWDSSSTYSVTWGVANGPYRLITQLYHRHGGEIPLELDNCLRIAGGAYNVFKREGLNPAAFMPYTLFKATIKSVSWSEFMVQSTIDPLRHKSLCDLPKVKSDFPPPPAHLYRRTARARASGFFSELGREELPGYYEAILTSALSAGIFMDIIRRFVQKVAGPHSDLYFRLSEDPGSVTAPEVLAAIKTSEAAHLALLELIRNQPKVPQDRWGFIPHLFLLTLVGTTSFYYRNRKILETEDGPLPWTWPGQAFSAPGKAYCTLQETGTWLRLKWPAGQLKEELKSLHRLERKRRIWESISHHLSARPDEDEVNSFIGFMKVGQGYDFSLLTRSNVMAHGCNYYSDDSGGKLFSCFSPSFTRIVEATFGLPDGLTSHTWMHTKDAHEMGISAMIPICSGTAHYISPPIIPEVLTSLLESATDIKYRSLDPEGATMIRMGAGSSYSLVCE
jgi:hypothetical protein